MTPPFELEPVVPPDDRCPQPDLPARYQRSWALFARWCAAADQVVLPATALTVAAFLDDHPGTVATHRTRLSAINRAHLAAGFAAPGRAAALRDALSAHRAHRRKQTANRVKSVVPQLPIWGWTCGLFGRRNAALLVLAASGMTYPQIAGLTQREVCFGTGDAIIAGGLSTLVSTGDPASCPVSVLRRWVEVLRFAPRPAGHGMLEHHLRNRSLPQDDLDPAHTDLPLFTSFDRRGYTPMHDHIPVWLQPLSATSIATIVTAHLRDPLPTYRLYPAVTAALPDSPTPALVEPFELADTYDAGIAARHRDHQRLNALDDLWDDFDSQADEVARMLARALAIADDALSDTGH
ncbi:hypothetical protein ACFXPS_41680 [Nocardia sp. NPDC059091]|uniref:hypothetical protein n=1 Tax=unclassified Nocardia TaxID=2637762 RepID=UPI0036CE4520